MSLGAWQMRLFLKGPVRVSLSKGDVGHPTPLWISCLTIPMEVMLSLGDCLLLFLKDGQLRGFSLSSIYFGADVDL